MDFHASDEKINHDVESSGEKQAPIVNQSHQSVSLIRNYTCVLAYSSLPGSSRLSFVQ